MIATSRTVKLLSVSAAALLHGAALWGLSGQDEVEIDGAAQQQQVTLGSSFADMAAGTVSATETEDATTPTEVVETAETTQPQNADTPVPTDPVLAETPETAQPNTFATPVEPRLPKTAEATQPTIAQPTDAPAVAADAVAVPVVQSTDTAAVQMSPEVSAAEPVASPEIVEAQEETSPAVARSLRPKTRSKTFEQRHEIKPEPVQRTAKTKPKKTQKKKPKQAAAAQPKGNAQQNAKAGSTTGNTQANTKAASSGQGTKKASGNAAASNYPGKVLKKISRVPKPRVGQKGTATVRFTIAANGGLASVSLARSSGSDKLDKAALRVVQKAAPFPAPPAGAKRSFSIKVKGR